MIEYYKNLVLQFYLLYRARAEINKKRFKKALVYSSKVLLISQSPHNIMLHSICLFFSRKYSDAEQYLRKIEDQNYQLQ